MVRQLCKYAAVVRLLAFASIIAGIVDKTPPGQTSQNDASPELSISESQFFIRRISVGRGLKKPLCTRNLYRAREPTFQSARRTVRAKPNWKREPTHLTAIVAIANENIAGCKRDCADRTCIDLPDSMVRDRRFGEAANNHANQRATL
jgi:hypothetical protein